MKIRTTQPQHKYIFSKAKLPAICGGLGSGKSQGGIMRAVHLLLREPGTNHGYYLPTYDLIKLRIIPGFEEFLSSLGIYYRTNKSDYTIKVHGYGDIIMRSFERPERIIAYEHSHATIDELDTVKKEKAAYVVRKIFERNRGKTNWSSGNTTGLVTTPDQGYSGYVYAKWVKDPFEGAELIKAPTASNIFLPDRDAYIKQIRQTYDPILAEMYIQGEFVSLSRNKVYHFFDRIKHHVPRVITPNDKILYIGLDFNIGGTCATVSIIEDNKVYVVDEFVSMHTEDFCIKLAKYKGHTLRVYPDASGKKGTTNASKSDIQIIRDNGFTVDCGDSNPAVRDRVNAVNALLSHDKLFVNTDKCPMLTDALESQGYDKKNEPEKFDEHPSIDDRVDSLGYFINRKFPVRRPIVATNIRSAQ